MDKINFFPSNLEIKNQKIILRLDLNVPIKNKMILDDTRIVLCLPFIKQLIEKYTKLVEKNKGEIVKTENWGLMNLSYLIKKNRKGSYIHFKIKGNGNMINELEKNESIDKKLLRFITIKVKKFDLDTNYFNKKDEIEKKESYRN